MTAPPAGACSCAVSFTIEEALDASELVVLGRVVRIELGGPPLEDDDLPGPDHRLAVTLEVERAFKGAPRIR